MMRTDRAVNLQGVSDGSMPSRMWFTITIVPTFSGISALRTRRLITLLTLLVSTSGVAQAHGRDWVPPPPPCCVELPTPPDYSVGPALLAGGLVVGGVAAAILLLRDDDDDKKEPASQ
jgi:hypothetical protein